LIALVVMVVVEQRGKQGRIASAFRAHSVTVFGPDVEGLKRIEAKHQIVRDLLAGRTSLLGAAAAFRRLDETASPRWVRAPQIFIDAASEEEAYCRSVVAFVRTTERSEETADRLQAEFNALLSSGNLSAASKIQHLN
jgi:hypothetical protein